jgi:flavin reductase (DIM6/NTAB) family NADH-FMN oxidoreductase RutF
VGERARSHYLEASRKEEANMSSTVDITTIAGSRVIEPAILYFGTPVVLIGSSNEDGSANLAPMSSAWWVGWRCMLGLASNSKSTQNLIRAGECVLNLPSADLVDAVNRLARTTGSNPVPPGKIKRSYRHEKNKFEISGLTLVGQRDRRRAARRGMPGADRGEGRARPRDGSGGRCLAR